MAASAGVQEPFVFYPNSDNFVNWGPVVQGSTADDATPTPVNDCTGTCTLYDEYGQEVPGATAISFSSVDSNGNYQALIPRADFKPKPGRYYRLQITLVSSGLSAGETWNVNSWVSESGPR